MARVDSFFKGQAFGLPTPVKHTPFGGESLARSALGLSPSQLAVAVALVAAEFTLMGPVTSAQLEAVTKQKAHNVLIQLQRAGLAEPTGLLPGTNWKLWRTTPKAWRELGFVGWSLLKEVA